MSMYFAARLPVEANDLIVQIISLLDNVDEKVITPNVEKLNAFAAKMKTIDSKSGQTSAPNEAPVTPQHLNPQPNVPQMPWTAPQMLPYPMMPGFFPVNTYFTPPPPGHNAPLMNATDPNTTNNFDQSDVLQQQGQSASNTANQAPPAPNGAQMNEETQVKREVVDQDPILQNVQNTAAVAVRNNVNVENSPSGARQEMIVPVNNTATVETQTAPGGSTVQNFQSPLTRKRKLRNAIDNTQENPAEAVEQEMKNTNKDVSQFFVNDRYRCDQCTTTCITPGNFRRHRNVQHNL